MKEEFALRAVRQISSIVDLGLSLQGLNSDLILPFNLHTKGSHCVKYEHPQSKNERRVCVTSFNVDLSIFHFDFRVQAHSYDRKSVIIFTPKAIIVLNINTLGQQIKKGVHVRYVRQIISIFDPDL